MLAKGPSKLPKVQREENLKELESLLRYSSSPGTALVSIYSEALRIAVSSTHKVTLPHTRTRYSTSQGKVPFGESSILGLCGIKVWCSFSAHVSPNPQREEPIVPTAASACSP